MDVAYTCACGIDVHQKSVSVSLLIEDFDTNRPKRTNRKYDTTTNSLKELACWLDDNDVQVATMESTGQYWRPVWQILSRYSHVELKLVNPQKTKRMPGRKTDKKDAEWLVDLTRVGMIEPSYVPELPTIELRESTRLRKNLTQQLTVVNDQKGRPTWTRTLAEFMMHLVAVDAEQGIYNLSNDNETTWYEFAKEILRDEDVDVEPVSSDMFPTKAYRPANSVLDLNKAKATGFVIPTWQEALASFQSEL